MKHHFIINPAAGKGTLTRSLAARIRERCDSRGVEYTIYETTAPGDAERYVRKAVSEDGNLHRFYACGGDGTLCEVINGAPADARAEFALIPIGTGNDFCRNFDERSAFLDIDRQLDGTPARFDLIKYNDRYSINMLNIGFDCNVVNAAATLKKKKYIPSEMAYVSGVAVTLFHKMTTPMHLELNTGEVIERPLLLITIANGRFCGGGFMSNPVASLDDGLFDVNIIEKVSRFTFLALVGSYKAGTHLKQAGKIVTYRQVSSLYLRFPREIPICVDGEIEQAQELRVSLCPRVLSFVLPAGVSCLSIGTDAAACAPSPENADAGPENADAGPENADEIPEDAGAIYGPCPTTEDPVAP